DRRGEVGGGFRAHAGRVGERRNPGDGADRGVLVSGGGQVGRRQVGDLLVGDGDGLAVGGDGREGIVLQGDGDGVGPFLDVGVRGRIDAVIAAAKRDNRAGVGRRVAPVDRRREVRGGLVAHPGRIGEGRDAGDRADRRVFLAGGRQIAARYVRELLVGDRDALAGARHGGQRIVLDGHRDRVGAFLDVGVRRGIDAVVAAAQRGDRARRRRAVAPVDGRSEVGGGLVANAGRVGEGGRSEERREGGACGSGCRQGGVGRSGDLLIGNRDRLAVAGDGRQGIVLHGDGDGVGPFVHIGVRRGVHAVVAAAGRNHRARGGGAVAPVDRRGEVGGGFRANAGRVGEGG